MVISSWSLIQFSILNSNISLSLIFKNSSIRSAKKWVGGVIEWQFLLIYSTIYANVGGRLGLKKPKICSRNTWMAPYQSLLIRMINHKKNMGKSTIHLKWLNNSVCHFNPLISVICYLKLPYVRVTYSNGQYPRENNAILVFWLKD